KGIGYYYLRGPILAFGTCESAVHEIVELDARSAADSESPLAQQYRLLGVTRPLASLWINPRAFDAHLKQKASAASSGQARALKALAAYWQSLEGIALSAVVDKDLELSLAVRANAELLPTALGRMFAATRSPTELW